MHAHTFVVNHIENDKGMREDEKISMKEKWHMGGDLSKAPKMAEAMLEDLSALQQAVGAGSSVSQEESKPTQPSPEAVALLKLITSCKSDLPGIWMRVGWWVGWGE